MLSLAPCHGRDAQHKTRARAVLCGCVCANQRTVSKLHRGRQRKANKHSMHGTATGIGKQAAEHLSHICVLRRPLRHFWLRALPWAHTVPAPDDQAQACDVSRASTLLVTPHQQHAKHDEDQKRSADARGRSEAGRARAGRARDAALITGICGS